MEEGLMEEPEIKHTAASDGETPRRYYWGYP